jgi:glycosyltransferase involved in cell wall biosynthesis
MIAVVIPCHRVRQHVLGVLRAIGPECDRIYVVDDACPERTGELVEAECRDARVRVLTNERNLGVGGATLAGLRAALAEGASVVVKLDGDGQMSPALIPRLVAPIQTGEADYVKGNRFFELEGLSSMPRVRLFGNSLLSFASKLSTGYWNLFDPTNGFVAIHGAVARQLPLDKLAADWFFESDLLFRLGTLRAVVCEVPMPAVYDGAGSNLVIRRVVGRFLRGHLVNTAKRVFYGYFLRNFNFASIELVAGLGLLSFGALFGAWKWIEGSLRGVPATSGAVMIASLPVLLGVQLLLGFLAYDLQNVPRDPLQRRLSPAQART